MSSHCYRPIIVLVLMLLLTGCHPGDDNEMADVNFDFDFVAGPDKESPLSEGDTVIPEKDATDTEVNDIDNGSVPKVDYYITGVVTSYSQTPITGIFVELLDTTLSANTNDTGTFTITGTVEYGPFTSPNLRFTDTDGAENGGQFKWMTREIHLFCEISDSDPSLTHCINDHIEVSMGGGDSNDDTLLTDDDQ
jgi:hypothetical protein